MLITAEHPKDEPDVLFIENYKGIVQSSGYANPQQAFIRALELVRTVKRVKSVTHGSLIF